MLNMFKKTNTVQCFAIHRKVFFLSVHSFVSNSSFHLLFCVAGAMLVICDVNEYRKCVKEEMRVPIITQLFEGLHALCNLLVVMPENLKVVKTGEQLVSTWNCSLHHVSLHDSQTV